MSLLILNNGILNMFINNIIVMIISNFLFFIFKEKYKIKDKKIIE